MKLRTLSVLFPLFASIMILAVPARAADAAKADAKPSGGSAAGIPGYAITRANGGYLSLQIDEGSNFKLSFYDAKKKPIVPDVASAAIRWTPNGKKGILFAGLNPGADGKSLSSSKFIQKPWAFKLTLLLFAQGSKDPVETYSVDFSQ